MNSSDESSFANTHYILSGTKKLRCGYTTGTCAALAAKAAATALLAQKDSALLSSGKKHISEFPQKVSMMTPKGWPQESDVVWPAGSTSMVQENNTLRCGVQKDAGDDSDVTDGFTVYATVTIDENKSQNCVRVVITGGEGVGVVTKPGLDQKTGEYAINHVPREMITNEVESVCKQYHFSGTVTVKIDVPGGKEIAKQTFNPQLGIEGGISILGTSGVVEPMSEQALVDSIEVEMKQIAAEQDEQSSTSCTVRPLIITPGNYGEDFISAHPLLKNIPVVKCSNFIGASIDFASVYHFTHVLFVGHAGKFVKLAGGIMNTHSHTADCRLELVACHAALCGAPQKIVKKIMECATVDAALDVLDQYDGTSSESKQINGTQRAQKTDCNKQFVQEVMNSLMSSAEEHVARRVNNAYEFGIIMFTNVRGEIAQSSCAEKISKIMTEYSVQRNDCVK